MRLNTFSVDYYEGFDGKNILNTESREVNRTGYDGGQYADDNGLGLHFEYRPLSYYVSIGKVQIGIS